MKIAVPMLALATPLFLACTVHATPGTTEITSAPVAIDTYPSTVYEGRPVYYYGDHWYYREGPRWRYYNAEPTELYRYRTRVQQAPPARYRRYERVAPPGVPQEAPPAYREPYREP
jgi:hypothetical protein